MGKKGPLNGEVRGSSPETSNSPSQNSNASKKKTDTDAGVTATDNSNHKAKPFDINDFFLSDTLLPFSGGVSFSKLKM